MSTLEITTVNANGVTTLPLELVDASTKLDLEIAILTNAPMALNCYKCHTPIPNGIGSFCNSCRVVNLKTCKVCGYGHEGLYCSNCFTGERVRLGKTKFTKVIKLSPTICKGK
jgi:hypothetical protein